MDRAIDNIQSITKDDYFADALVTDKAAERAFDATAKPFIIIIKFNKYKIVQNTLIREFYFMGRLMKYPSGSIRLKKEISRVLFSDGRGKLFYIDNNEIIPFCKGVNIDIMIINMADMINASFA